MFSNCAVSEESRRTIRDVSFALIMTQSGRWLQSLCFPFLYLTSATIAKEILCLSFDYVPV